MDNFKRKMLSCGIYGTKLNTLTEEEIKACVDKDYTEIFYTRDICKLTDDLNGDTVEKTKDLQTIINKKDQLSVRAKFFTFKEHLKRYKFKGTYPYKIIDLLLRRNEFVKNMEIMSELHLDAKRVFYVLKKLRSCDVLIEERDKQHLFVKLQKDAIFEIQDSETIYERPIVPCALLDGVPLLDQIGSFVDKSLLGVTTTDIREKFGISAGHALHFLSALIESDGTKYRSKEIFMGKIRCFLYYKLDQNLQDTANAVAYVTVEGRINAINTMLEDTKYFVVNEEVIKHFQNLTKAKFVPCKKTIMSTALKAGHKIYFLKEKNENLTLVLHKSMTLDKYFASLNKDNIVFKHSLEEKFYTDFVLLDKFVIRDNFYETNPVERCKKFYNFLSGRAIDGFVVFDQSVVDNMPVQLVLEIIPINIPNLAKDIQEMHKDADILHKLRLNDLIHQRIAGSRTKLLKLRLQFRRFVKTLRELESFNLLELFTQVLSDEFKHQEEDTIVYKGQEYKKNICATDCNVLIKLHPTFATRSDLPVRQMTPVYTMTYDERMKLMDIVKCEKKNVAYRKIIAYIRKHHHESLTALKNILIKIFGYVEEDEEAVCIDSTTMEYLYTKVKYDLYKNGKLVEDDYDKYYDIKSTLSRLYEDCVIVKVDKQLSISHCGLSAKYETRLQKNHDSYLTKKYLERDTVYSIYFDIVYTILLQSGSLEFNDLLEKIKVCKDFELTQFLIAYSDVFETNDIEEAKMISLKLDVDPFALLDTQTTG